jgi:phytoene dehydrogenase-like protein
MSEAVVVGSGPNGLAGAITLARAGLDVTVYEAADSAGGGARSGDLLGTGLTYDVCSAVHPFGVSSPFFERLDLGAHGLEWVHPRVPVAHPLDGEPAVLLHRDIGATALGLGPGGVAWRRLVGPLARRWDRLAADVLGPVLHVPRDPLGLAVLGIGGVWPASLLARRMLRGRRGEALFAGLAAHSVLPLDAPFTAAVGLVFGATAHARGWPVALGGSQAIVTALLGHLRSLGGRVVTGQPVETLEELGGARVVLLDVSPRQFVALAARRGLPGRYRRAVERFRQGAGVHKVDYVLDGPVPWRDERCLEAGTVHVGGTFEQIAAYERAVHEGRHGSHPFVLVAQQSLFDRSRVTGGREVLWAYCHVPHGSDRPMGEAIDAQVERFAPGFRDRIVARLDTGPAALERANANYHGGDISGGANDRLQLFMRPVPALVPYRTPLPGVYLCSASTPPGAGVHGMCGHHAARRALRDLARSGRGR